MIPSPPSVTRASWRDRRLVAAYGTLALMSCAALLIGLATSAGVEVDLQVLFVRLRSTSATRAFGFATVAALLLLGTGWRAGRWRVAALTLLAACAACMVPLLTVGRPAYWASSDGAMAELYVLQATRGAQFLGAYSTFGWSHPGPMLYYWLVPFYVIGHQQHAALGAGALVLNILCLSLAGGLLGRRSRSLAALVAFWACAALFLARMPGLLTSAWNPHAAAVPMLALMVVCAAVVSGWTAGLPVVAGLASLTAQAHVGVAPVSVMLLAVATANVSGRVWTRGAGRRWLVGTGVLVLALWILPLAEQLTGVPGNVARLVRFFLGPKPPEPPLLMSAWKVWGATIAGLFDPAFTLPNGHGVGGGTRLWPAVLGTALVAALPLSAGRLARTERFGAALALVTLAVALVSFWSVDQIQGVVADHQVFWISVIGIVATSVHIAALAAWLGSGRCRTSVVSELSMAMAVGIILLPGPLQGLERGVEESHAAVRYASETLLAEPDVLTRKLLFRTDNAVWEVTAGVLLEAAKAGIDVRVDEPTFYGRGLAPRGDEDIAVMVVSPERHRELLRDPRVRTLGAYAEAVYLDIVSLDEAPEYLRRWTRSALVERRRE